MKLNYITIDTIDVPELEPYKQTSEVQLLRWNEPKPGLFIAESAKVIERALQAGYEPLSILVAQEQMNGEAEELLDRIGQENIGPEENLSDRVLPVYVAQEKLLKEIKGFHLTRGLMCVMVRRALPDLRAICQDSRRIAVLEDIENPTNVGAIFRSAAALGMDAVLLTKGCADPLYRRAARVSMGCVFQIPWTFVGEDYIEQLHQIGFKTAAMALEEDSYSIRDEQIHRTEKLAVIMGNEGTGLSADTLQKTDYTVMIPMFHGVDSLNVAAASAVAFWEVNETER